VIVGDKERRGYGDREGGSSRWEEGREEEGVRKGRRALGWLLLSQLRNPTERFSFPYL